MTTIKVDEAIKNYLFHFHIDRDYFECHEILEDFWKSEGQKNPIWVGLIQIAVGFYHYRRGNITGAKKLFEKAKRILESNESKLDQLGFNSSKLLSILQSSIHNVQNGVPYQPIDLPVNTSELNNFIQDGRKIYSNEENDYFLLHKHKLRDRSKIIQTREQVLNQNRFLRKN